MQYKVNTLGQRVEKMNPLNANLSQFTVDDDSGHVLGGLKNQVQHVVKMPQFLRP